MRKSIHWLRRDLRLTDNTGLHHALNGKHAVQCIFIFDRNLIDELDIADARISFIYEQLRQLDRELRKHGSCLRIYKGKPADVWSEILENEDLDSVYVNKDYEPYAIGRDADVQKMALDRGVSFHAFKDHVIFEESEIVKKDGNPYTVYTPYRNCWLSLLKSAEFEPLTGTNLNNLNAADFPFPELEELGFQKSHRKVAPFDLSQIDRYAEFRDYPAKEATSRLGPHLRFGTISPRQVISKLQKGNEIFLSELIWREFFIQILYQFPRVVNTSFKEQYDRINWRYHEGEFLKWCEGKTGIPIVDAGMRELNETGFMHNRVRMIVASFLTKHLLIDWRWGEAYFAKRLLDYELASNNGNWQWAAGTGCDASPYFRVFNPEIQAARFDPQRIYIRRWVSEYGTAAYPKPMVDLKEGRQRALETYKKALQFAV